MGAGMHSLSNNPSHDAWIHDDGIAALTNELDDTSHTVCNGMLGTDHGQCLLHLTAELRAAAQQSSNRGGQIPASPVEVEKGYDRFKAWIITTERVR